MSYVLGCSVLRFKYCDGFKEEKESNYSKLSRQLKGNIGIQVDRNGRFEYLRY